MLAAMIPAAQLGIVVAMGFPHRLTSLCATALILELS